MLGSAGEPFTAKFLVRRLSANFTTLMRSGSAPDAPRAACRIAARSALQGALGCASAGKALRNGLANTLCSAGYERCAAREGDLHVSISSRIVSNDCGCRPSSMS